VEVVIVRQQIKNNDIINFVFFSLSAVLTMLFLFSFYVLFLNFCNFTFNSIAKVIITIELIVIIYKK